MSVSANAALSAPRFLPWLRTGLAIEITTPARDGLAPHDSTDVTVTVQVRASGTGGEVVEPIAGPGIRMRGPGEVVGLDPAQVLRHSPEPGATDAEPLSFVQVELAAADLPWRFTPAAPAEDKLQPWIALVVVEERDGVELELRGTSLPVLHVDDAGAELPPLAECWAWAHVHTDDPLADGVATALAERPEVFRSRLLCPRRLTAQTSWIACLVPTFGAGRLRGLGEPVTADAGPAWDRDAVGEVRLPVYFSWRFSTGAKGDFESLVRRLRPRELAGGVGRRDVDLSDPGGGLPAEPVVVTYEGALVSPAGHARDWPVPQRTAMKAALRTTLNGELRRGPTPDPYDALRDDPVVGPPAYAAAQAGRRAVPDEGKEPVWLGELNTEPYRRAVAGLGAEVVRHDQEALMAAAWASAASLAPVNRTLTSARLAWELGRAGRPRFDVLSDAEIVQVAGPALPRLRPPTGGTLRGSVAGSALPAGLVTGAFRRRCSTVRSFAAPAQDASAPRVPATAAVTVAALRDAVGFVGSWADTRPPLGCGIVTEPPRGLDVLAQERRAAPGKGARRTPRARRPLAARLAAPRAAAYDFPPPVLDSSPEHEYTGPTTPVDTLARDVRATLDPTGTVVRMVEARVVGLPAERDFDVPARLRARPQFTTPMYERLTALSADYLVPGAGDIPDNTLGLLEVNRGFVEAFLAGLNTELGREFLWREYPAALDATWAKQFWDPGPDGPPDIAPIGAWDGSTGLGRHPPPGATQASLVLVLKGALPRRYPDLRVYAAKAAWVDGARRESTTGEVALPLFAGVLERDVYFYGFALTEQQARGSTSPAADPGWFFVLEEQPGATRFGLDAAQERFRGKTPRSWADLSWSHLVAAEDPLPTFVDLAAPSWLNTAKPLPGNGPEGETDLWAQDAAAMARITLQRPVRMLVHAGAMLPDARRLPGAIELPRGHDLPDGLDLPGHGDLPRDPRPGR